VTGPLLAVGGAYGVHLLYTALAYRWAGIAPGPAVATRPGRAARRRARWRDGLAQAGLDEVRPGELAAVILVLGAGGAALGLALFGGVLPALAVGAFAATAPVASARARRQHRRHQAAEAWPRLIDEIRLLVGSMGRSVPQALLDAGGRGPEALRPAFAAARREWLLSTDFERTVAVLKARLADPTADAVGETLLVAHEVGGGDLDRRLAALGEDRLTDLHDRKDALARQAGVRFARRFVLLVPFGMAFAGLSIGNGRVAYQTPLGQTLVAVGIGLVALCWVWAGRFLRLPQPERVLAE
jgi:tight adherence protein B